MQCTLGPCSFLGSNDEVLCHLREFIGCYVTPRHNMRSGTLHFYFVVTWWLQRLSGPHLFMGVVRGLSKLHQGFRSSWDVHFFSIMLKRDQNNLIVLVDHNEATTQHVVSNWVGSTPSNEMRPKVLGMSHNTLTFIWSQLQI